MNIIRICGPSSNEHYGDAYKEWKKRAHEKVGISLDAHVVSYPADKYEFIWVDKNLYRRTDKTSHFVLLVEFSDGDPPHIMCECGRTTFELRYYGYQLDAICPDCKKSSAVYDG